MKKFKNLKELEKYANRLIKEVIKEDIAPKAIDVIQDHIEDDVYSYEPQSYKRTGKLIADESFEVTNLKDGVSIMNTRTDEETGKYIPSVIVSGEGYDFKGYGYGYEKPRPFIANARQQLQDGLLKREVKKAIVKKGIKVE